MTKPLKEKVRKLATPKNITTLEKAKPFRDEAITPYEKILARSLVVALEERDSLRDTLSKVRKEMKLAHAMSKGRSMGEQKIEQYARLQECEYASQRGLALIDAALPGERV